MKERNVVNADIFLPVKSFSRAGKAASNDALAEQLLRQFQGAPRNTRVTDDDDEALRSNLALMKQKAQQRTARASPRGTGLGLGISATPRTVESASSHKEIQIEVTSSLPPEEAEEQDGLDGVPNRSATARPSPCFLTTPRQPLNNAKNDIPAPGYYTVRDSYVAPRSFAARILPPHSPQRRRPQSAQERRPTEQSTYTVERDMSLGRSVSIAFSPPDARPMSAASVLSAPMSTFEETAESAAVEAERRKSSGDTHMSVLYLTALQCLHQPHHSGPLWAEREWTHFMT